MATRKTYSRKSGRGYTRKPKEAKKPAGLIFWAAFFVLITGLFFINREHIRETLESTQLLEKISPYGEASRDGQSSGQEGRPAQQTSRPAVPGTAPVTPEATPQTSRPATPEAAPPASRPAPQTPRPAASEAAPGTVQSEPRPIEQRSGPLEQSLYFIHVNDDGAILRNRVTRYIPISGTPLQDTLLALIAGPGPEEEDRGMISLIPPGTRILSAAIEGNTARISFSEEFQYNTAGMEGFIAQLTQVVWTATEFPNVRDVQILIEGNRIDHLGEGVPIWNPLNRQSF